MRLKAFFLALSVGGILFAADKVLLKKPPESLKKYYPPASKKLEYLSNMHAMSTAFYGIRLNVNEGRWDKAKEWALRLKDTYLETSRMVPEWKDYFKPELAENLVKAVESKNPDRVVDASMKLGQTCSKCHQENQIAVRLVYHFPSFREIKVEDPVELTEYDTKKYMGKVSDSMKALRIYLTQGDLEKAREEGMNFVERTLQLRSMCSKCHTDKQSEEIIMGKELEAHLSKLKELLSAGKPNREEIFKTLGPIGASCSRCHNVHLVPALVQEAFRK